MFDSHSSAHVTVQKPDLFSVAVHRGDLPMSGCQFCQKTIFFNGATWVHANDEAACKEVKCVVEWTKETEEVTENVYGLFRTKEVKMQAPISRCSRCGQKRTAFLSGHNWHSSQGGWGSKCSAAVATPRAT